MEDNRQVSVVIVNYNHGKLLEDCLHSLNTSAEGIPYEAIVVDNKSRDGSADSVASKFPNVQVIRNSRNLGFARAVNQALHTTNGRHVLVLNPDVVVKPFAITRMVNFLEENPDAGVVGCKLFYPDGNLQWSCRTFYTPLTILFRRSFLGKLFPNNPVSRKHLMVDWDHNDIRQVDWVMGACMLVRKQALEKVGPLDENFFLYFEDVDWCYRMKQHGYKVYYYPYAEMIHYHHRRSAGPELTPEKIHHVRSMLYYYKKHFLSEWRNRFVAAIRRFLLREKAVPRERSSHVGRAGR